MSALFCLAIVVGALPNKDTIVPETEIEVGTATASKVKDWLQDSCHPDWDFHGCKHGECKRDRYGCSNWWCPPYVYSKYYCSCDEGFGGTISTKACDNSLNLGPIENSMGLLSAEQQKYVLWGNELADRAYKGVGTKYPHRQVSCEGEPEAGDFFSKVDTEHWHNIELPNTVAMAGTSGAFDTTNYMIGGVLRAENQLPLAFVSMRGTDNENSAGNWFSNLEYFTDATTFNHIHQGKSCNVHQGFLKVVLQNYDKIMQVVDDVLGATAEEGVVNKILVSGHSLGGALANIVAAKIKAKHPDVKVYLTTIGAPRTGDATFAKIVEEATEMAVRIVDVQKAKYWGELNYDVVTQLPNYSCHFCNNAIYYMHAGQQINVGWSEPADFHLTIGIALHMQDLYIKRIKQDIKSSGKINLAEQQICNPADAM